MQETTAKNQKI